MGVGISLFFIAAGAVMAFAVDVENTEGFNINTIGVILMVVGAIGVLLALTIFGGRGRGDVYVERDVMP
jgi:hypothetical protein